MSRAAVWAAGLAAVAWVLCGALTVAAEVPAPRSVLVTLQPEFDASCQCAGHRSAAFAAQMAGAELLDDLVGAGATLRPVVQSYHRASVAESVAAFNADLHAHHTDEERTRYSGTQEERDELLRGALRTYVLTLPDSVPDADIEGVATVLRDNPAVEQAAVDHGGQTTGWRVENGQVLPTDPFFTAGPPSPYGPACGGVSCRSGGAQWALKAIEPEGAWQVAVINPRVLGSGVNVGIIDSGVDSRHPDLGANYAWQWDRLDPNGWCQGQTHVPPQQYNCDPQRHGSHVAGIAAGAVNDYGMVGVAPYARLHSLRIVGITGSYETAHLVDALVFAFSQGLQVVNMSLRGPYDTALHSMLSYANFVGVTLVASSGNSYERDLDTLSWLPGSFEPALTVGATTPAHAVANFSSWGHAVDVVAPGGGHATALTGFCRNQYGQQGYFGLTDSSNVLSARSTFGITDPFAVVAAGFTAFHPFIPDFDGCLDGTPAVLQRRVAGDWLMLSGTSMAAPHVTGIAAGVRGAHGFKPFGTEWVIKRSARALPGDRDGFGLVSFSEAIQNTRRYKAVADTSVLLNAPDVNYNHSQLVIGGPWRGYVRFHVPALPHGKYQGALLRLYVTAASIGVPGPGWISALVYDGWWQESTLTWNTQPNIASQANIVLQDGYGFTPAAGQWLEVDVSGTVKQGWNDYLLLASAEYGTILVADHEQGAALAPELVVQACSGCGCRGATVYQAQLPVLQIFGLLALWQLATTARRRWRRWSSLSGRRSVSRMLHPDSATADDAPPVVRIGAGMTLPPAPPKAAAARLPQ